jgi:hypothetical protein
MEKNKCDIGNQNQENIETSNYSGTFKIAENPPKNFKRYTIGFDANSLSFLRSGIGYRLFGRIIRQSVFK